MRHSTRIIKLILAVLPALVLGSGCATLSESTSGRVVVQNDNARVEVAFNEHDRERIYGYYNYKHKGKKVPPGLAKKGKIPPGHQKQLERWGTLPPGLAGRSLPYELERDLSPLPGGYIRVKLGTDVAILDEKTRVVIDVIHGVGS